MRCMICGSEIQNGSTYCPICGADLSMSQVTPANDYNQTTTGYESQTQFYSGHQIYGNNQQTYGNQNIEQFGTERNTNDVQNTKSKKHIGLIIGIASAIVVIATVFILLIFVFDVFSSKNGTYRMNAGNDGLELVLEIDGDEGELTANIGEETIKTKFAVEFNNNEVKLSRHGITIYGDYDKKKNTISIKRKDLDQEDFIPVQLDGKYYLIRYITGGERIYERDELIREAKKDGYDLDDYYNLDISRNTCKIGKAVYYGADFDFSVSLEGNEITFTIVYDNKEYHPFDGTYDKSKGQIILKQDDGVGIGQYFYQREKMDEYMNSQFDLIKE